MDFTLIYQNYLNSFPKDFIRSLDNERLHIFSKSFEFIQQHNDKFYLTTENNDFKSFHTTSDKANHKPAYFLRLNQFSDLTQAEINSMFIKDAPTFDSIANYRRILEKNDVTSNVNEYFQYNLRRKNTVQQSTEWYIAGLNKNHSGSSSSNTYPSLPASLSTATFNWATTNNPKQRSILPNGIRNQGW
jgi:hypothetical protein